MKRDEVERELERLTRIAEQTREHLQDVEWYNLDKQTAGRDSLQKMVIQAQRLQPYQTWQLIALSLAKTVMPKLM